MLLNYHIGRLVLSSLCVGDLVRLVLSDARVAGWFFMNVKHTGMQTVLLPVIPRDKRIRKGRENYKLVA